MKKILPAAFLALWTAALCLPEAARALAERTGLLSFEPFPTREEKRYPAPRPDLFEKAPRLVPRSLYGRAAENWYNDHFAWRTELVRLGRRVRFGVLREPVGRDVPGLDGWLFMRSTWRELEDYIGALPLDDGALAEWVELFEARHAWAEACGTHCIELLTAPKARVRAEKLRPDIRRLRDRGVADRLRDALAGSPARDDVLFVDDDLAAGLATGREVFFAADHHPTPYGLWILYDRINRRLLDLFPDRIRGTFPWYDDPPPAVLDGSAAGCWPRDGRLAVSSPGEAQDDRTICHNAARYPYCNVETDRPEGGLELVLAHDSFLRFTLESWCGRDGDVRFPFAPGVGRVRAFLFRRLRPDLLESETALRVPDAFVEQFPDFRLAESRGSDFLDANLRAAAVFGRGADPGAGRAPRAGDRIAARAVLDDVRADGGGRLDAVLLAGGREIGRRSIAPGARRAAFFDPVALDADPSGADGLRIRLEGGTAASTNLAWRLAAPAAAPGP